MLSGDSSYMAVLLFSLWFFCTLVHSRCRMSLQMLVCCREESRFEAKGFQLCNLPVSFVRVSEMVVAHSLEVFDCFATPKRPGFLDLVGFH